VKAGSTSRISEGGYASAGFAEAVKMSRAEARGASLRRELSDLRNRRLRASTCGWEGALDILVQKVLELTLVPSRIGFLPFHDESRVGSDPITQGFVESERRLNINQPNEETMFVQPA
jgi:hypothetical protein